MLILPEAVRRRMAGSWLSNLLEDYSQDQRCRLRIDGDIYNRLRSILSNQPITRPDIDQLLAFLPKFEDPGFEPIERWAGGTQASGALTWPYPIYAPEVMAFFSLAGQSPWNDYSYNPAEAGAMLQDDVLIASASFDQIRVMLTGCVRGERFSDGYWGAVLREGRIQLILRRLAALRDTVP